MFTAKNISKLPFGLLMVAAVPIKKSENAEQNIAEDQQNFLMKRTDLPLYTPLYEHNKPKNVAYDRNHQRPVSGSLRRNLESTCGIVRKEVQSGIAAVEKQKDNIMYYVDTAKSHTLSSIDYLNQPHNLLPRTGAIAIGGLAGFIFATRGGFIKKVLYTTFGAGGVASLCYPEQASKFAVDSLYEARKGYAIAYNFVKGVKPGDGVSLEPINKFPSTVEDVKHIILDLYDETINTLFTKKS